MSTRELILLSPYRLPTHNTLYLGDEEVAAFLNGYIALWHPASLHSAMAPPSIGSPYDHEQPTPGNIYAVPEPPDPGLPEDWKERLREVGAIAFTATQDREETIANLLEALREFDGENTTPNHLLELDRERVGPFFGLGFGYVQIEGLFEAMSHDNLLDTPEFWTEIEKARNLLGDTEKRDELQNHLESAANVLVSAREVLYPSPIYLIDLLALEPYPTSKTDDDVAAGESFCSGEDDASWPLSLEAELPLNLMTCSARLEHLAQSQPERIERLRERMDSEMLDVCGGIYIEREDAIMPVESQLWNLQAGQRSLEKLLGQPSKVFARQRFGWHPYTPALLQHVGIGRALLIAFGEEVLPTYHSAVVSWPAPDGSKQVDAFTRKPHLAGTPQTFFHFAHYLNETIMQDMSATVVLLHDGKPGGVGYQDLLELCRLAPVLGRFSTFSEYFDEVMAGDYTSPAEADEFHDDYLVERTLLGAVVDDEANIPADESPWACSRPVSGMTDIVRMRRTIDSAWTLAALQQSLGAQRPTEGESIEQRIRALEEDAERTTFVEGIDKPEDDRETIAKRANAVLEEVAGALARRLVARGEEQPGYLLLNPCSYTRRILVEIPDCPHLLPTAGPIKACQIIGTTAHLVAEVPAMGFAWFPRKGDPALKPSSKRMRLADEKGLRNEFFEGEIDPATGGLRAIRDHRMRATRVGQQLVFQPGSEMCCDGIEVVSTGPALGEVVTTGAIVDKHENELARFRQRFQTWIGRPMLDIQIEITPNKPPQGHPWHAYYASRFAWRDEYANLVRGVCGGGYQTTHTRPVTPDFLELSVGQQNTVLFPGGLPFHQRHGGHMLDVLLITPGEESRTFDIGVSIDRPIPLQSAQGVISPVVAVPVEKGPPHVGDTGWLCHVDASNLLLTSMRPADDGSDAVEARFQETSGYSGMAEIHFVRNPKRAHLRDMQGELVMELTTEGDATQLEFTQHDLLLARIDFSDPAE